MSAIDDLKSTLKDLLINSSEPIVIAIKAPWGAGKTFFWKKFVSDNEFQIKPSYISVFGAHSMEDIRQKVVFEILYHGNIGKGKWVTKISSKWSLIQQNSFFLKHPLGFFTKLISNTFLKLPKYAGLYLTPSALSLQILEDSVIAPQLIICLDDIERLSNSIKIDEFLGYVDELKTGRCCKVVLIYNNEKLGDNENKFRKYNEKVIDRNLPFLPNVSDIVKDAFEDIELIGDDTDRLAEIARKCQVLSLKNIRLLTRTKSYYYQLLRVLPPPVSADFLRDRFSSILLFVWAYQQSDDNFINLEKLTNYDGFVSSIRENDKEENSNNTTLYDFCERYGYKITDEVDTSLIKFIQTDILESKELLGKYLPLQEENKKANAQESFSEIWRNYYHGTLRDTSEEFAKALEKGIREFFPYISIDSLDESLYKLQVLGHPNTAGKLLSEYLDENGHKLTGDILDWLFSPLKYEPLKAHLESVQKVESLDTRNICEVIDSFKKDAHMSNNDKERFAQFSVEEIANHFMSHDMQHLTSTIRSLAKDGAPKIKEVAQKIAGTNSMNMLRMESMGLIDKQIEGSAHK